ncbi:hypothetical protein [Aeoliella mucimassa]|nr:hypothetical protein [Aeoliella mucimassa]
MMTPVIAVSLFVLEAMFLHLGPNRAAYPFCIVFIVNQTITTIVLLIELNLLLQPSGQPRFQVTLKTLLVLMTSFALFSGVARFLLRREHNWIMLVALGLLGLTLVGLASVGYEAFTKSTSNEEANPEDVEEQQQAGD